MSSSFLPFISPVFLLLVYYNWNTEACSIDSHYKSQLLSYVFVRFGFPADKTLPHLIRNVTISISLNTKEFSDMKQERWKSILKPLTILPVIVMLCTIFGFSNQNGTTSGGLSQK